MRVACALAAGSYLSGRAVLDSLLPVLLPHVQAACTAATAEAAQDVCACLAHVAALLGAAAPAGVDMSPLGSLHPLTTHAAPLIHSLLDLTRSRQASPSVRSSAVRCLAAVLASRPPIDMPIEAVRSVVFVLTDLAILGEDAPMTIGDDNADSAQVTLQPQPQQSMEVDTAHDRSSVSHEPKALRGDAQGGEGGCCGGEGHDHSHSHDHKAGSSASLTDGSGDSDWLAKVARQAEQGRGGTSSQQFRADSPLLRQAALEALCQGSMHASSGFSLAVQERVLGSIAEALQTASGKDAERHLQEKLQLLAALASVSTASFEAWVRPLYALLCQPPQTHSEQDSEQDRLLMLLRAIRASVNAPAVTSSSGKAGSAEAKLRATFLLIPKDGSLNMLAVLALLAARNLQSPVVVCLLYLPPRITHQIHTHT